MNKRVKLVLLILILILLVLIISSTYSKYTSESEGIINKNLATWLIKVNDTDITVINEEEQDENTDEDTPVEDKSVTFEITGDDVVWEGNSHISEGKVAPGMKGYFYIRIDPKKTQTALKYTINISIASILEGYVDFRINGVTEESGKEKELHVQRVGTRSKNVNIQRVKELDEIKSKDDATRIDKIKVELEWVDSEETGIFDTKVGETIDKDFKIPVTVNAIQYTGEAYDF